MNKNQLDNFIGFCFTNHTELGNSLLDSDCEYIYEKWSKFIGVKTNNIDVNNNQLINKWIEKWKVNQKQWNDLKEIVDFLSSIQKRPLFTEVQTWRNVNFNSWTLEELIELFTEKTGLTISQINDVSYNHIHANIKEIINEWLEKPVNKRVYNLYQIGL
jgi:hypothetical protein